MIQDVLPSSKDCDLVRQTSEVTTIFQCFQKVQAEQTANVFAYNEATCKIYTCENQRDFRVESENSEGYSVYSVHRNGQ